MIYLLGHSHQPPYCAYPQADSERRGGEGSDIPGLAPKPPGRGRQTAELDGSYEVHCWAPAPISQEKS